MTAALISALRLDSGDRMIALVNGLGATTCLELYGVYHHLAEALGEHGVPAGPMFDLLFQALAAAAAGSLTTASLAADVEQGLAAIQRVGEAEPGDKTLADAGGGRGRLGRRAAHQGAALRCSLSWRDRLISFLSWSLVRWDGRQGEFADLSHLGTVTCVAERDPPW
jgi:hypothetical protein